MVTLIKKVFCGVALFTSMTLNAQEVKITTESLLQEMLDINSITYFPEVEYTQKQFSSYDRASDKADKSHYTWFANSDASQFLYRDSLENRVEHVMFDAQGPGCVTRWWMTFAAEGAADGILRIYIDNSKEPMFEGNAIDFLGSNAAVGFPLSWSVSEVSPKLNRGHNLYLPIPYSKSCKITYENKSMIPGKWHAAYYNINYRTYNSGVEIESISKDIFTELYNALKFTNQALINPNNLYCKLPNRKTWKEEIAAGETKTIVVKKKNSAINNITLRIDAKDVDQALRSTIMQISFDGEQTIWVPVGDFFASGACMVDSYTWRTKVNKANNTLSTNWLMPFKKRCEISFINLADETVAIEAAISHEEYEWIDGRSMYLGASWYMLSSVNTGENKRRMDGNDVGMRDLNFVTLQGKGVYVGDALTLYNTAAAGRMAWWGEGDEKIYVDGEQFPSHFGTGTEDYYGYAWCRPEEFIHPFIAQPIGEGNLAPGRTINSRFRTLDAITFNEKLQFDMELWHWSGVNIDYSPTTFYYMLPGGTSNAKQDVEGAKHKVAKKIADVTK